MSKEKAVKAPKTPKAPKVQEMAGTVWTGLAGVLPAKYITPERENFYGIFMPASVKFAVKYRLTFVEPFLATAPMSMEGAEHAIAGPARAHGVPKSVIDEDLKSLGFGRDEYIALYRSEFGGTREEAGKVVDKWGKTIFYRRPGDKALCLKAYQILGYMKETSKEAYVNKASLTSLVTGGYRKFTNADVHMRADDGSTYIPITLPNGDPLNRELACPRPVIRENPQHGEPPTAIICSEAAPTDSTIEFTLTVLHRPELQPMIQETLALGIWRGIGAWRNSGKGRFVVDILSINGMLPADYAASVK